MILSMNHFFVWYFFFLCSYLIFSRTEPKTEAAGAVLQHTKWEATRLFLMAARQGATEAQIADSLLQGLPDLTASLQDTRVVKQSEGTGTHTKQGKKEYDQEMSTLTTCQAPTTQPALLAADVFAEALATIPAEDWCRTWAAGRTIMLRRTSNRVKEVVDKMRLPAVVRLSRSFWDDARDGTAAEKLQVMMRQLAVATARCRISTLELPRCEMKGQDAESLAEVLGQCRELVHLDLSYNQIGPAGEDRLAGVLGECRELVHLNLSDNEICEAGDSGRSASTVLIAV